MDTCCKKGNSNDYQKIGLLTKVCIAPIRAYRFLISPWVGHNCRFIPTCSHYAEEAIIEHGILKGAFYAICRLGKCHPWHKGGYDPVPSKRTHKHSQI